MAIPERDIKLLWGRAAGRCSAPDCHVDLAPFLQSSGDVVLGEMAHNFGRRRGSARYDASVGTVDTYDNLILLCPSHHTLVDKAPADYPVELLRRWKADWEAQVASIDVPIESRLELMKEIATRLAECERVHSEWGPTSARAMQHPESEQAAALWHLRRLSVIIPNNSKIVGMLHKNTKLLTADEWRLATGFIEHAQFYEGHCGSPKDATSYLAFPLDFADFVNQEVRRAES